jgi:hypothetical protein
VDKISNFHPGTGNETQVLAKYLRRDPSAVSYLYRRAEAMGETEEIQQILLTLTQTPEAARG